MNLEPQKWRDGIDPFTLPLKKIKIKEVLGYPHAGNQVFFVKGEREGEQGYFYVKYAHRPDANIKNEVEVLKRGGLPLAPRVVEYDGQSYKYSVTEQIEGRRLSVILKEAEKLSGLEYMREYGRTLGLLHCTDGSFDRAPHRAFHDIADRGHFVELGIESVFDWLNKNKPTHVNECFIHGDFHYANVLWRDGRLVGMLDFELAGIGNREFDIAWAVILRPGQEFMRTEEEIEEFLGGYGSVCDCDRQLVRYYMALIYSRFIKSGEEDYAEYIKNWFDKNIQNSR